ncbi:MAG: HEAT repeat domain-containing protein [Nostocaceae cyanobacterium]|nr:HEAT repeat domain-containing protein [Nostocaceae cyanobacterium]
MNPTFLGRTQEQKKFTEVLNYLVNLESDSQKYKKPYIFLFYGTGGIGKTTLLQKLKNITTEKYQEKFNTIFLDWEQKRDSFPGLQIGHDYIQPATVLEVIYQSFVEQSWENYFSKYCNTKNFWQEAKAKIKKALESELEDEKVQELRTLGTDGITELLRESKLNSGEEEFGWAHEFVKDRLTREEQNIYQDPETNLADALADGITNLAKKKPLIIFFDTYEIVDRPECDYVLREAIKGSIGPIVWVIAGRANLADSGWRNPEAKNSLLAALEKENQDPDVVAVAIKLLGNFDNALAVPSVVSFLKHRDRFVRRAAARELGKLAKYETDREQVLKQAVDPLIQVMRNNAISNVRETALEALVSIYKKTEFSETKLPETLKVKRALWREKDTKNFPEWIKERLRDEREKLGKNQVKAGNLEGLLRGLGDSSPEVRERSAELLGKLKDITNVQPLVQLLNQPNEDPDVRATVAEALGEIGSSTQDVDVIDALIQALNFDNENDRYVRQAAATALRKLTLTEEAIKALNKAAREDVISNVRNYAIKSLEYIRNNADSTLAQRYLQRINREDLEPLNVDNVNDIINILKNSSDIDEKIKAVQTFSRNNFNTPDSINALIEELDNPDPDICAAAADSLGKIHDSRALKPLLEKLNYKDRIAREAVIKAIGNLQATSEELDEQQAVERLIDIWRNDPISNVRDAVEFALQEIYKNTQPRHPNAYEALKRYPDYDKPDKQSKYDKLTTKEYYKKFFTEYSQNHDNQTLVSNTNII